MRFEFPLKFFIVIVLLVILTACAPITTSQVGYDNAQRLNLRAAADQGDAETQYLLGESYCCGNGYYSTDEAVKWWCRAALQTHLDAKQRLSEVIGNHYMNYCRELNH